MFKTKGFLNTPKKEYLGKHLLLDFWGVKNANSIKKIEKALRQAVKDAGATLLKIELHKFSPQGISGVAIIAESHISIHTWPENDYAAIDIFICGEKVNPYQAVKTLKSFFRPDKVKVREIGRGV